MVKLTIGGGQDEGGNYEPLPAIRQALLFLQSADLQAGDDKFPDDRIKWVFEIVGQADEEFIGRTHHVYTNLPKSKSGKVSTNSNLFEVLSGLSGGDFEPDDEVDTDTYVGGYYTGDFRREQKKDPNNDWKPLFDENGKAVKKTVLRNLYPADDPNAISRPKQQSSYKWSQAAADDDDE